MRDISQPGPGSKDGKVVRGKDGWLFLDRDTNRVMGQQSGEVVLTPGQVVEWRELLESRDAWLTQLGARYVFVIAPNSGSIYPEMLPDGVTSTSHRPVHQLLDDLSEHASQVRMIYPEDELLALKQLEEPFVRNETHWRDPGAFRAYECLMDELGPDVVPRRLTRDDLVISSGLSSGDLGHKLEPPVQVEQVYMRVAEARAQLLSDNRVFNTGRTIVHESPGVAGTCVVFSDSFGYRMIQYLAESFGRLVFVFRPTLDFELLEDEQPSAVVSVVAERFLVRVPLDEPFVPTRVIARRKYETGGMLAPIDDPPPVWPPLDPAED